MIDVLHIALGAAGLCCAGGWALSLKTARKANARAVNCAREMHWIKAAYDERYQTIDAVIAMHLEANASLKAKLHRDTPRASNGRFVKKGAE